MIKSRVRYVPRTRTGRRRSRRRLVLLATVVLLSIAAAVAGVVLLQSPSAGTTAAEEKPPVTAALFGTGASPEASWATFETAMKIATDERQHLLVGPLTSTTSAASNRMTADGSYDVERNQNLQDKQTTFRNRFRELVNAPPGGTAMDGLHALDQHLVSLPHSTTDVLLVGNVLQVAPGVDLNDPVQRGDIEASLAKVVASGLMPHCQGWRVHVVAGSASHGQVRDSQLDLEAREFWRQLVAKCGGELTLWDTSQLPTFPSAIPVPAATFGPPCQLRFTLPADVLFAPGRWDLQPGALPTLQELLVSLTMTHPDAQISIDGHTDSTGGPGYDNYKLARLRAESVQWWLNDHGVAAPRTTATGFGPEHPVADNSTDVWRQLNRRVEIRLQLSPAECPNR